MDCFNCGGNWPPPLEYFLGIKVSMPRKYIRYKRVFFLVLYSVNRPAVNVISVIVLY